MSESSSDRQLLQQQTLVNTNLENSLKKTITESGRKKEEVHKTDEKKTLLCNHAKQSIF